MLPENYENIIKNIRMLTVRNCTLYLMKTVMRQINAGKYSINSSDTKTALKSIIATNYTTTLYFFREEAKEKSEAEKCVDTMKKTNLLTMSGKNYKKDIGVIVTSAVRTLEEFNLTQRRQDTPDEEIYFPITPRKASELYGILRGSNLTDVWLSTLIASTGLISSNIYTSKLNIERYISEIDGYDIDVPMDAAAYSEEKKKMRSIIAVLDSPELLEYLFEKSIGGEKDEK